MQITWRSRSIELFREYVFFAVRSVGVAEAHVQNAILQIYLRVKPGLSAVICASEQAHTPAVGWERVQGAIIRISASVCEPSARGPDMSRQPRHIII